MENPQLRLSNDVDLGPTKRVLCTQTRKTSLKKPKTCFVEWNTYMKDYPQEATKITDAEKVWEQIDGEWVHGAS